VNDPATTDPLRRTLQRGYLTRMAYLLEAPESLATDIAPLARGELLRLTEQLNATRERTSDEVLILHLDDIRARIERILGRND
jgi:hypothetical protein